MLIKPRFGWVTIKIDEFEERASYLTCVSLDCIDAMIHALSESVDFVVNFDAEGYTYKVISDDYRTFVIMEKDEPQLFTFDKDKDELAKEILSDIKNNIEDWRDWEYSKDEEPEEYEKYNSELNEKLKTLEDIIQKKHP